MSRTKLKSVFAASLLLFVAACATVKAGSSICPGLPTPPPSLMEPVRAPSFFPKTSSSATSTPSSPQLGKHGTSSK